MKTKYFNWERNINEEELKRVVNILDNDGIIKNTRKYKLSFSDN